MKLIRMSTEMKRKRNCNKRSIIINSRTQTSSERKKMNKTMVSKLIYLTKNLNKLRKAYFILREEANELLNIVNFIN